MLLYSSFLLRRWNDGNRLKGQLVLAGCTLVKPDPQHKWPPERYLAVRTSVADRKLEVRCADETTQSDFATFRDKLREAITAAKSAAAAEGRAAAAAAAAAQRSGSTTTTTTTTTTVELFSDTHIPAPDEEEESPCSAGEASERAARIAALAKRASKATTRARLESNVSFVHSETHCKSDR